MFSIDGVEYRVKCTTTRSAEIKESQISGIMMDGQIFRDVVGTYYSYDIRLEMPLKNKNRYASLIERLTEPVDGHPFVLPYNNGSIQLTGKVVSPRDVYKTLESGYTYWDGLQFSIAANHPTKQQTLTEAIRRGITAGPYPEVVEDGDTYTYSKNAGGWVPVPQYEDADSTEY